MANAFYAYPIFNAFIRLRQLFALTALANGVSQFLMVITVLKFIKLKKLTRARTGRVKSKLENNLKSRLDAFLTDFLSVDRGRFISEMKNQIKSLPVEAKSFFKKGFIILGLYLIGDYFLFNTNYWVNRDITYLTTDITTKTLNWLYKIGFSLKANGAIGNGEIYYLGTQKVMLISNGCNAFKLHIFYLGFLFCLPGKVIRKLLYGVVGIVTIFYLNIGRCFTLTWLNINRPEFTDFAHHYAFTFIVYSVIFLFFWIFLNRNDSKKDHKEKITI